MSYQPLWLRDLVAYSIQAAALVGIGAIMSSLLQLRVPRVRLAYWQALLAVCVFLPLLQPWRPEILETPNFAMSNVTLAATDVSSIPTGPSLAEIVLWLICAGVVLRLAWMALGLGRLWLYRRHAERIHQTPEAVREAQRLVPASSWLFISHQIPTPATFGFFQPAILFPARFLEMEPAMQKAIALHELLHVERRDWLWSMFEEVVLTLLWFHLPLWWVVSSARLSREQVVDAEAVRRSHERRPYLKALLEMAGQKRLTESLPAPLFLRESQLAERVSLMMKEVHMSRTRLTISILTATATLLIAGVSLVWAFPLKTEARQADKPAAPSAPAQNTDGTYEFQGKEYKFDVKVYKVGGKVSAPTPIYRPEPPYTPEAKKAHLSGTVVLWAVIDAKGKVVNAGEQSNPLGKGLDESALNTVRTWTFKPGMREGVAVPVKVMIEISFRLLENKKLAPVSQDLGSATDPPAQDDQNASEGKENNHNVQANQADNQRQIDEVKKQVQLAQQAPAKIDQAKIQEQIDLAMKQLKLAEAITPKIDQAKINQQIEQAMKQVQMSQAVAPKIDQKMLQEQVEQSMKQLEKMNTPEVRLRMQEQMEQLKKLDTPEMRRKIQDQMEQLKKMNTPEMRQQLKQAMEQAMMAQESAGKMDKAEVRRQLEEARKQVEQARQEAQAARKEAEKARQDAMNARREAEAQRKAAKPSPSVSPKPAPAPPKKITPPLAPAAPPAPPAAPKTPESAGIVGGVPGGVVGGVPGGVVRGVSGGKVSGVQGGLVKGIEGGLGIGVPGGITDGVITAPQPAVPPSPSPKEAVPPPPPASPAPSSPPQN